MPRFRLRLPVRHRVASSFRSSNTRTPSAFPRHSCTAYSRMASAPGPFPLIQEPVEAEVLTTPEEELEYLFDRYLRPYIATHDGIVNIETIDEPGKQLWISMEGGCSGCPSSIATLKHGIERTLKQHLPWVERVDTVTEAAEPDFNIALDFSASS